ncbi:MAG: hypothetical protein M3Y60_02080 [Bacteroidota bacterium]|nr:hypothetical protein [Bacteroidota bacterium]
MEIEELRDIWKKQTEGFKPKDAAELSSMLKGKSTSIVTRLKRNVWMELIFTFAGGLGLLVYAMTLPPGSLKWISVSMLVLFCVYSFYYLKKLRLLNRFDPANEDLKSNLSRLIEDLKSYLRFYKRSYAILYPVYFFLGLLFTAVERGTEGFINRISQPEIYGSLLLVAFAFFIGSTWLTSWYLKKLYGNHLEKLEGLLKELEA